VQRFIYIHTPLLPGWMEIYEDLVSYIPAPSRDCITSVVLGKQSDCDSLINPVFLPYPIEYGEFATLQLIWNHARYWQKPANFYYVHLKGITHARGTALRRNVDGWRRVMSCLLFHDLDWNEGALDSHDCMGPLFDSFPLPHFSGNFWASTTHHINKLSYPAYESDRLSTERWICSSGGNYVNLYPNEINRYEQYQGVENISDPIKPISVRFAYRKKSNGR